MAHKRPKRQALKVRTVRFDRAKTLLTALTESTETQLESKSLIESAVSVLFGGGETKEKKALPVGVDVAAHPAVKIPIAPSFLKLARSVFAPGKTYRMRLSRLATLTTSGAGAFAGATSLIISNFAESSAVNALFDECRVWGTRIHYAMLGFSGFTNSGMISSFDPSNASTVPTAALAAQIPGAKIFPIFAVARVSNEWRTRTARPWSIISNTDSGTDPVGGSLGTWYHVLVNNINATVGFAQYILEVDYEFRNPL